MTKFIPKVIAVVNQKGGIGKTTTSTNLAAGLAMKVAPLKKNVLLIDLDPQNNCAKALGLDPEGRNIANILIQGKTALRDNTMRADRSDSGGPSRPNLWLIPSGSELAGAKQQVLAQFAISAMTATMNQAKVPNNPINTLLTDTLGALKGDAFPIIIIDCPPSLDTLSNAVYDFADIVILPIKTAFLSAVGAAQHVQTIVNAQSNGIEIAIDTVVPTFYKSRERLCKSVLENVIKQYGGDVVCDPIPHSVRLPESGAVNGQTIFEYMPNSKPALAYQKLVDRIYNRHFA